MQKEVSIYDIDIKNRNKEKIGTLVFNYDYNYDDIKDRILSHYYDNIYNKMEIDKTYYLIEEDPWKIAGVISLCKGYTFIDCAEHDDRVIIKSAFPDKICNIVGE